MFQHRFTDEEFQKIFLFTDLNNEQDQAADSAEENDDSDDFKKYDDVDGANVDLDNELSRIGEKTNENRENDRPTFNRTYDKNSSDVEDVGQNDGEIAI